MGRLRGSGDPTFVELGERLEKLRQDYEAGVIKAIDWLKGLLDAAKDTVQSERLKCNSGILGWTLQPLCK
jgi:type I restriction enzyme R subunit